MQVAIPRRQACNAALIFSSVPSDGAITPNPRVCRTQGFSNTASKSPPPPADAPRFLVQEESRARFQEDEGGNVGECAGNSVKVMEELRLLREMVLAEKHHAEEERRLAKEERRMAYKERIQAAEVP